MRAVVLMNFFLPAKGKNILYLPGNSLAVAAVEELSNLLRRLK